VSQLEVGTSLGQGDGRLWHRWWVLFMGGLGVRAQNMLEPPLAEWFYVTEYISSVFLAFQDQRRQFVTGSLYRTQCARPGRV